MLKTSHQSKSPSKKKRKVLKNHKQQNQYQINITGFEDVAGVDGTSGGPINDKIGMGDNVMDCLDELASAQVGLSSLNNSINSTKAAKETSPCIQTSNSLRLSPPPPPGVRQIPSLRIELARHLHTQNLSTFLLQSCPGLRMPTFERWLLDSKLEESDRFQSIIEEWMDNPSLKLAQVNAKSKKKHGRAAMHQQKYNESSSQREREKSRKEKDCILLLGAEKGIPARPIHAHDRYGVVSSWVRNVNRDPILPYHVMEYDSSCDRLLKEITATMSTDHDLREELDQHKFLWKGREIVRDLCHRATEACNELRHLEQRLGKFQKFGWDTTSTADRGAKKKRKRGSSGNRGGNVDRIHVEWQKSDALSASPGSHTICSLIYVAKKRKSLRPSSAATDITVEDNKADDSSNQHKPKPFVIKLNASHYHKLRAMFDATYKSLDASTPNLTTTSEQSTHAFHSLLFAMVLRYSSLSGGQQINDWRGGGMQGAVHEGVFNCFSKWFGGSGPGTECFASPFNSTISRFFSAFPSPDIDGHFGSHGDFFHLSSESGFLRPGWYELNPPFSPAVMSKMANRIGELIEVQCKQNLDVTFIVVIPTVRSILSENGLSVDKSEAKKKKKKKHKHEVENSKEKPNNANLMSAVHHAASQSFRQLIKSPYCKSHIILLAREHGYIEGGQHLRPTKFKESQYSTSVIVLKSESWKSIEDMESFERDLRKAFASLHTKEVEQRKQISEF